MIDNNKFYDIYLVLDNKKNRKRLKSTHGSNLDYYIKALMTENKEKHNDNFICLDIEYNNKYIKSCYWGKWPIKSVN